MEKLSLIKRLVAKSNRKALILDAKNYLRDKHISYHSVESLFRSLDLEVFLRIKTTKFSDGTFNFSFRDEHGNKGALVIKGNIIGIAIFETVEEPIIIRKFQTRDAYELLAYINLFFRADRSKLKAYFKVLDNKRYSQREEEPKWE